MNDPFYLQGDIINPLKKNAYKIPDYRSINPIDMAIIIDMGRRASQLIAQVRKVRKDERIIPPHQSIAAQVIATVHLQRPLDLRAFAAADDLAFIAEFAHIYQHLDQLTYQWPPLAPLRYAQKSS